MMEIKEITQNYPLSLLLEADPDIKKIEKYLNKGRCFGGYEENNLIGVYVLKNQKDGKAEIMNLAVAEKFRRNGYARELLCDAEKRAKAEGFKKLLIATGKSSFQHHFYEKCGFTVYETDPGYFERTYEAPIIDNGVTLSDLVRLEKTL